MEPSWVRFAAIVTARHSKRAFLDKPVPHDVLARVLTAAAHAPSTRNGQPWRVAVVTGAARDELARRLCAAFDRGVPQRPDYPNRTASVDADVERRWRTAGAGLLHALGIARDDAAGRRAHVRANLEFHGAPAVLICHLPADAAPGTFLEMGFFLQNTMLGLVACGLGSCPQFSVAGYPEVLRAQLGLPGRLIVCALAVGYPDPGAPVNGYVPDRLAVADYVSWHDQPPTCG
ncbi:nitroreductase [Actinomycetes bacterium KLBMP 9797]